MEKYTDEQKQTLNAKMGYSVKVDEKNIGSKKTGFRSRVSGILAGARFDAGIGLVIIANSVPRTELHCPPGQALGV
tara:strand:- start:2122 stop:2349 length:228 start_codon:yes stop_codon:yes gene_type:complete